MYRIGDKLKLKNFKIVTASSAGSANDAVLILLKPFCEMWVPEEIRREVFHERQIYSDVEFTITGIIVYSKSTKKIYSRLKKVRKSFMNNPNHNYIILFECTYKNYLTLINSNFIV